MKRLAIGLLAVAVLGVGVFWWLTSPSAIYGTQTFPTYPEPDVISGEHVFWASGCASCYAKKGAKGDEKLLLGGGHRLETPFGTFITPNISPDKETGIGLWDLRQFATAMQKGLSPEGKHYYPSFPYSSYARMTAKDVADLFGYLKTLSPVIRENEPHELALPYKWRRPVGVWKRLYAGSPPNWKAEMDSDDQKFKRGRYLVEALGHCGECHTPRNFLGGLKSDRWLAGGPAPEGEGKIPNITPHQDGIGSWSESDIVYYLETGFTPDFDSVGGSMTSVQENMANLPKSDLEAVAAYLKAIPAVAKN